MEKIILASGSPRRSELLEQAGIPFEVIKSGAEEIITKTEPGEIVKELSFCKARTVVEEHPGCLVLGADTIVVLDGQVLGKPKTKEHAMQMLREMQGRAHQVYTGVTVIRDAQTVCSFYEKTEVVFYPMTDDEIRSYVESGDCMDKAGAYGIQGSFAVYIKEIHGDYYNVMGLPVGKLWQELKACHIAE
ncbi:Maf family protein [Marvinbryantia formatexigens]|nr:Maf family protein [Marvinbryantia formatexigens]UWO23766.1 Maf family protein [Marvinbryantia formatexigens DSM 14469]SDF70019.1 septum formation protein [Marvinbryantia formatexigens]